MKLHLAVLVIVVGLAFRAAADSDSLLASLQPKGHVSDFAGVFDSAARDSLEQHLLSVKNQTGAEIAVVTLPSLEGGEIDDFTGRLFERWGVGQKGKDNGAMVLMAVEERKIRIEVGYGLEGAIPDARAGRIRDEDIVPRFKEGAYAAGLANGTMAMAQLVMKESGLSLTGTPAAGVNSTSLVTAASTTGGLGMGGIVFIVLFFGFIAAMIYLGKKYGGKGGERPSGGPSFRSGGGGSRSSGGSSGGFSGFSGGRSGGGGASGSW